jgi:monoterpene epsilon-lactone hydrolase
MPSEQFDMLMEMIKARPVEENPPIEEARAYMEEVARMFRVADDVKCKPLKVGDMDAEWITVPDADEERVVLYLHGGGYAMGSLNTHREMVSRISRDAKARALTVDYRLGPEHPYPAAVEDATAAYRWLLNEGAAPSKIAVAGDSAGGGLTVATLVALKQANETMPAAAVCLSPWVDLEGTGESMTSRADADPVIKPDAIKWMAKFYAGEADLREPLVSPIYADLKGLPPMLIQVGTAEVLFDDSTRLAERARAAGVDVVLEPWEDMIHVWQYFAAMLPEGREAIERIGEFIIKHTA